MIYWSSNYFLICANNDYDPVLHYRVVRPANWFLDITSNVIPIIIGIVDILLYLRTTSGWGIMDAVLLEDVRFIVYEDEKRSDCNIC